ncbi:MAG: tetraacyldisaccharide 4'-kinase [Deltaproteobacteria bacterium]|nr:tetraacyldisaccharide 4'-kinase [Deltaproteobacteria bacterium]
MCYSLRKKIEKGMRHGGSGVFLYAASLIYGIAVAMRLFLYRLGVFKTKALDIPVISIGNLTTGGTGKTPMTMHVARILKERGFKPAILSRGYRGSYAGIEVVSDGRVLLAAPDASGDEPYLMAKRLLGHDVPVVVGRDRYKAGLFAVERFSPDVVILDDGFQHIRLKRDIDILLIDNRIGFGNARLLPAGYLREPLGSLGRADVFMLKGQRSAKDAIEKVAARPVFYFSLKPTDLRGIKTGEAQPLSCLKGRTVLALTGIAVPESFYETIEALGVDIKQRLAYPDHHPYTEADIRDITRLSAGIDMVVTTEKDAVRLKSYKERLGGLFVIAVDVELDDEKGFAGMIITAIRRHG